MERHKNDANYNLKRKAIMKKYKEKKKNSETATVSTIMKAKDAKRKRLSPAAKKQAAVIKSNELSPSAVGKAFKKVNTAMPKSPRKKSSGFVTELAEICGVKVIENSIVVLLVICLAMECVAGPSGVKRRTEHCISDSASDSSESSYDDEPAVVPRVGRGKRVGSTIQGHLDEYVWRKNVHVGDCIVNAFLRDVSVLYVPMNKDVNKISRVDPGKKIAYIKRLHSGSKEIVARQYMLFTITEAFQLFKDQHPEVSIGHSKFAELRPSQVKPYHDIPHNVCVCRYHENFENLRVLVSQYLPIFGTSDIEFVHSIVCDSSDKNCMNYNCAVRKSKFITLKIPWVTKNVTFKCSIASGEWLTREDFNLVSLKWTFFASSHGKGTVDVIGAVAKRHVWNNVCSQKTVVRNADTIHDCCKNLSIQVKQQFPILRSKIRAAMEKVPLIILCCVSYNVAKHLLEDYEVPLLQDEEEEDGVELANSYVCHSDKSSEKRY
ncbi:hypothetical protein ANN_22445 [Periplaneta americana]|uniref:Uncharacterized protein n=1 Tax=Periplaneta americana TaxID=6978 RepID=A0ABQ8S8E8_PERAM|nr:hypothetical protein ANN_22445 [Periplaneta americana]